jgi:hypothetical protein
VCLEFERARDKGAILAERILRQRSLLETQAHRVAAFSMSFTILGFLPRAPDACGSGAMSELPLIQYMDTRLDAFAVVRRK